MKYQLLNGKFITIPDNDLERIQRGLKCSQEEAIETWLVDEGYEIDETVEELSQKAKDNRITATICQAKAETTRERKPRPKKEDPEKTAIINKLAEILPEIAENVVITNETKLIEFDIAKNHYKLDLIRQRPPKK